MTIIIGIFRAIYFYGMCIRASKKLHKKMFESVMSTYMRFFDLNPLGINDFKLFKILLSY